MTRLEKYELINSTKTGQQLYDAIGKMQTIEGSSENFTSDEMQQRLIAVSKGYKVVYLTRSFSIRQQYIYLNSIDRIGDIKTK